MSETSKKALLDTDFLFKTQLAQNRNREPMDTLIETLENLKDAVLSIDVPNIEPFPEPEMLPDPESEQPARPEANPYSNDLPF